MKQIQLSDEQLQQIVSHLEQVLPEEGCGLAAGREGVVERIYPITNILASRTAYEMDPMEQLMAMLDMDEKGLDLLGIYHSHPFGPSQPSITDVNQSYYPEAAYLIISWDSKNIPTARAFSISDGKVFELEIILG